ncbi:MAG TPA: hypothetical protein VNX01_15690 [Bacteroidia bacterium]|jgi:hypothetical protein|nr:hypothetical protein [Bacteroidia bacterium]
MTPEIRVEIRQTLIIEREKLDELDVERVFFQWTENGEKKRVGIPLVSVVEMLKDYMLPTVV